MLGNHAIIGVLEIAMTLGIFGFIALAKRASEAQVSLEAYRRSNCDFRLRDAFQL